eukprot:GEMP01096194.1.p1 GENE.GEMP01096194.1~~GEMP01096194.1.p1  ORF type:complete len:141 (+),score=7.90 GEMP01096194.1:75-497(+)
MEAIGRVCEKKNKECLDACYLVQIDCMTDCIQARTKCEVEGIMTMVISLTEIGLAVTYIAGLIFFSACLFYCIKRKRSTLVSPNLLSPSPVMEPLHSRSPEVTFDDSERSEHRRVISSLAVSQHSRRTKRSRPSSRRGLR